MARRSRQLVQGLGEAARAAGVRVTGNCVGTMFTTFFTDQPVTAWSSAKRADTRLYAAFFRAMQEQGVYFAPSQFEAGFMSAAHGDAEIQATLAAAERAFTRLA